MLAAAAPALGSGLPVPVQPGLGLHTAAGTAGNKQPMQPGGLQMEAIIMSFLTIQISMHINYSGNRCS